MPIIVDADRKAVFLQLAIEEVGVVSASSNNPWDKVCIYSVYDPSGVLNGDLEITCKPVELEERLGRLRVHGSLPSVFLQPVAPGPTHMTRATPPAASSSSSSAVQPSSRQYAPRRDAPADISAGGLIADLAKSTGTVSPFTQHLADLVDDWLRPQSGQKI